MGTGLGNVVKSLVWRVGEVVGSQLNGYQGEVTGTDDMPNPYEGYHYGQILQLLCLLGITKAGSVFNMVKENHLDLEIYGFARTFLHYINLLYFDGVYCDMLDEMMFDEMCYAILKGEPIEINPLISLELFKIAKDYHWAEYYHNPRVRSQLNGNNGEVTNGDDFNYFDMVENYNRAMLAFRGRAARTMRQVPGFNEGNPLMDIWFFYTVNLFVIVHALIEWAFKSWVVYEIFRSLWWINSSLFYRFFALPFYYGIQFPAVVVAILLFYFWMAYRPVVQDDTAFDGDTPDPDELFRRYQQGNVVPDITDEQRLLARVNAIRRGRLTLGRTVVPVNQFEESDEEEDEEVIPMVPILERGIHVEVINTEVRGGGKGGKSMLGKVNFKGKKTGKNVQNVQAPEVLNAQDQQGVENEIGPAVEEVYKMPEISSLSDFVYSDFPKSKSLFARGEIGDRKIVFDCFGAPFCGMVAIDVACGIKPKLEDYYNRVKNQGHILDCGTNEYLKQYAAYRGVNLGIEHNGAMHTYANSPNWKYALLVFVEGEEESTGTQFGHYKLLISEGGTESYVKARGLIYDPCVVYNWFFKLFEIVRVYRFIREYTNANDRDERQAVNKRDGVEVIENYVDLEATTQIRFMNNYFHLDFDEASSRHYVNQFVGFIFFQLNGWRPLVYANVRQMFGDDMGDWLVSIFNAIIRLLNEVMLANLWLMALDTIVWFVLSIFIDYSDYQFQFTISATKAKRVIEEAEGCAVSDRPKCVAMVNQMRYVHDDVNADRIRLNTVTYLNDVIRGMKHKNVLYAPVRVAVNANTCTSIIPSAVIAIDNQVNAMRGGGVLRRDEYNHVVKCRIRDIKRNVPVAVCPTISFHSFGEQLGPGNICVTDSIGELTAFMRSMSRNPEEVQDEQLEDFTSFSKKFIDRVVQSVDVSKIKEEKVEDYFRKHYTGKRSKGYIDGVLADYEDYKRGCPKRDFLKNQCFVKLENSQKIKNKKVFTRPRLIMVMNQRLLIEYCQVIDVINQWNDSYFGKFQIKHMSEEEMMEKVMRNMNRKHIVTDYSSFECSITNSIRELESYAILNLLKKSGLTVAHNRYLSDCAGSRLLKTKNNTFSLNSRNSGDFHTSWMNGLQNVLLSAYCYSKEHPEDVDLINFDMVAEGDDGIRAPGKRDVEIVANLGFSFSVAVEGSMPGDVDFLRVRWLNGKRYLSVGRALKIAWVTTNKYISLQKAKSIQRCSALSLHYMSPGHPILWAISKRIAKETAGHNYFKGLEHFINSYSSSMSLDQIRMTGSNFGDFCICDESMRAAVAEGTTGFPPIPIAVQLALEDTILNGDLGVNIMSFLEDYDDVKGYLWGKEWIYNHHEEVKELFSDDVKLILGSVKADLTNINIKDYKEQFFRLVNEYHE